MFSDVLCEWNAGFTDLPKEVIEITASYRSGLHSGLFWPDQWNHRPGGPFVFTNTRNYFNQWDKKTPRGIELDEMARVSALKHAMWMNGWDEGTRLRKEADLHWTVANVIALRKACEEIDI